MEASTREGAGEIGGGSNTGVQREKPQKGFACTLKIDKLPRKGLSTQKTEESGGGKERGIRQKIFE